MIVFSEIDKNQDDENWDKLAQEVLGTIANHPIFRENSKELPKKHMKSLDTKSIINLTIIFDFDNKSNNYINLPVYQYLSF